MHSICPFLNRFVSIIVIVTEMQDFLIFTRRSDIRKISMAVEYYADVVINTGSMKNAIAVDVDTVDGG